MDRELQKRALDGDEEALTALKEEARKRGKEIVIMQRHLQSYFVCNETEEWVFSNIVWTPWHSMKDDEPLFYIDEGLALRTIKSERTIELIESAWLDPKEITSFIEGRQETQNLKEQLAEAIEAENYEEAARLRDALNCQ